MAHGLRDVRRSCKTQLFVVNDTPLCHMVTGVIAAFGAVRRVVIYLRDNIEVSDSDQPSDPQHD